jgi:hypothetical protein
MTKTDEQVVKQFDCIKVKRAIQSQIMAETAGMSTGELLAYFNSPAGAGALVPFSASEPRATKKEYRMKKLIVTLALCAVCAAGAVAQEGAGSMGDVSMLNVNSYNASFGNYKVKNGSLAIRDIRYIDLPSDDDWYKFSVLGGDQEEVDTELEFALLSYYSQPVINIRPVAADAILPKANPVLSDKKLGAAVLKEMRDLQFAGQLSTDARGRYEGMLTFITDRGNVRRADIENFLREGIAALATEQFNKISFLLRNYAIDSYNAVLSRNPGTGELTVSYDRKTISGRDINALADAMSRSKDFDTMGIEQTRTQAELIPAVVYAGWLKNGVTRADAVKLAADTIANYYLEPTEANYNMLVGVFGLLQRNRNTPDPVADAAYDDYSATIYALNEQLGSSVGIAALSKGTTLARAARAKNPDYDVFSTQYNASRDGKK